MRLLRFACGEALASFRRGWRASVTAVLTVGASAFVLGLLLWLGQVGHAGLDRWKALAEMSIFLKSEASTSDISRVREAITDHPAVQSVEFVSAAEARTRLLTEFPEATSVLEGMASASVPASFEVQLAATRASRDEVPSLVARVQALPGVDEVRFDRELIDRVAAAAALVEGVGVSVIVLLLLTSALTVTSVVRLAYEARRDEVEIMYLVGAPSRAIRGPFAVEGGLQAGLGALLGMACLAGGALFVEEAFGPLIEATLGVTHFPRPSMVLAVGLLGTMGMLGVIAGVLASRGGEGRWFGRSVVEPVAQAESETENLEPLASDGSPVEADR